MSNRLKLCGHRGCTLSTSGCCGCEDSRPITRYYLRYSDGIGYIKDYGKNARFSGYCPPCKAQFESGLKRCICGLVSCDLTTDQCCVCLDARPQEEICYKYQDGRGMTETCATRWMHYCPPCRERSKRQTQIRDAIPSQANSTAVTRPHVRETSHKLSSMSLTPSLRDSFVRVDPPQAINSSNVNLFSSTHPDAGWTEVPKDDPPPYSEFAEYEFVNYTNRSIDQKPMTGEGVVGSSKSKKESRRGWFKFFWKH
jgi:hypothetical protein